LGAASAAHPVANTLVRIRAGQFFFVETTDAAT
jgi:hypothetical protein